LESMPYRSSLSRSILRINGIVSVASSTFEPVAIESRHTTSLEGVDRILHADWTRCILDA